MEELKPCPFCGEKEGGILTTSYDGYWYAVFCDICMARTRKCRRKEDAIEAWNRRVSEIPAEHFDPNYMRFCPVCGSANGMSAEQKEQFYGYLHGKGADLDPRKLYALNDDGTYTEIAAEMEDGEDGK